MTEKPAMEPVEVDWVEWDATVGLFQAAFWLCHTQWHRSLIKAAQAAQVLQGISSRMWTAWKVVVEGDPQEGTRQLREGVWILFALLDGDREQHAADPANVIALPRFEMIFATWRCHLAGRAAVPGQPTELFADPWQIIRELRVNVHEKLVKP